MDVLGASSLTRRLCLDRETRAGLYVFKGELLLVLPMLAQTGNPPEVDNLVFLCRENLLLTIHSKSILGPAYVEMIQESDAWLSERSIAGLVSAAMVDLSQEGLRHIAKLKSAVRDLETRMDRAPDTIEVEDIMHLRSELLQHEAVVSDQLPAIESFNATDRPYFKRSDAQDNLNCAMVNLQANDRSLDRLDARIATLRSAFQMHAQDQTNRRLGVLTILSAIFMPITLLAGIWGMNFETMPELSLSFAYPAALTLMVLIGTGMFLYFRRTGWFN